MQSDAFIATFAGHGNTPGYSPTADDEQRALFEAFHQLDALIARLATHGNSPVHVLLTAMTLEHAQHALDIAKMKFAQLSRQSLVHELPAESLTVLRSVADNPVAFVAGEQLLPEDPRTVPTGRLQFKTPADCLAAMTGIDYWSVLRRINAADDLLPGTDQFGIPCGPRYPKLAEQLATGQGNLSTVAAAARKLEEMRPAIEARPDAAEFARGAESRVAESIGAGEPKNTKSLLDLISDELGRNDAPPTKQELRNKTGILVSKRTRHLTYFTACMLNEDAEIFLSHFAASDNARTLAGNRRAMAQAATIPSRPGVPAPIVEAPEASGTAGDQDPTPTDPLNPADPTDQDPLFGTSSDGPDWFDRPSRAETFEDDSDLGEPDPDADGDLEDPTPAQRHLQTLLNLMRTPRSPGKGATGLPTSTLFVYINLETLAGLARGAGWSAHGLEIPVSRLRQRLTEFNFIPIVLGGDGQILDYGRARRYPPESMKAAIRARDRGCLKPGCTTPPEHCEFHHIKPWSEGGGTSVQNLGMFCTSDHRAADNGDLTIIMKNGVPWVILPQHEDPAQIPRRNTHWQGQQPPLF